MLVMLTFFISKLKKQTFLHHKVLENFVTSKSWTKISCPRIYFLICTSDLSLPFIRLFIGFLKKYFQWLLHCSQLSWVCCLQVSTFEIERLVFALLFSFSGLSLCTFLPTRTSTRAWHHPFLARVLVTTQQFTSGMPKTLYIRCIRSIWILFGLAYLLSICGNISKLPSAYVNPKCDILSFAVDYWRIVLAFVRTVSKISAHPFIGHLLFLILVVHLVKIKLTTCTSPFLLLYHLRMSGFLCSSFVTLTSSCKVLRTTTFLLPDFFLSMYNARRIFLSL